MTASMTVPPDEERLFQEMLSGVQRPVRYIGGEWNQVVKDHRDVDVTFALAYPDVYEIGMSHLGFRILYSLLNAREDTAAERVFCPWPDMADALRRHRRPLTTLETQTPLREFDVVGFSLQYEMTFTNVLEMLDLVAEAGIDVEAAQAIYRLLAIAKYDERFVVPTLSRTDEKRLYTDQGCCGFE